MTYSQTHKYLQTQSFWLFKNIFTKQVHWVLCFWQQRGIPLKFTHVWHKRWDLEVWWPCPHFFNSHFIKPNKNKMQNLLDKKFCVLECKLWKFAWPLPCLRHFVSPVCWKSLNLLEQILDGHHLKVSGELVLLSLALGSSQFKHMNYDENA